jgi:hypothetical protein
MARRRRPPRPGGRPRGARKRRKPPKAGPRVHQIPDTEAAQLEERTRKEVIALMQSLMKDTGLVEDQRVLARIMEQHPEYGPSFADAENHKSGGDPESPFVHLGLHKLVEERVLTRQNSSEMSRTAGESSWHEAVHDQLDALAKDMFGEVEEAS